MKSILLFLVMISVFSAVFYLYRLNLEAILYAGVLSGTIGLIANGINFYFYYKRHRYMEELKENIIYELDKLPTPRNLTEQDYTELIMSVNEDKVNYITNADNLRSEMVDYYTLWAHQIKTPIAAMRLILQAEEEEKNRELLGELFKTEQYVEMVLSYLRLNSDYTDYIFKEYDLSEIVKQSVRKYASLFIRKKIRLNLELKDISCKVITDEKWLSFVIEQLLSNALKYTKQGFISIYLKKGNTLVIEDTGIGIAPEDLPRVCEKGFTGYNGRSDKKATGIGLYLCKRILSKLNHGIEIESEVGKGTRVLLTFDLEKRIIE